MMLNILVTFLLVWVFHILPQCLLGLPIVILGRKRVKWYRWELSILVVPFLVYIGACTIPLLVKPQYSPGLANFVFEPIIIGCIVPVLALVRIYIGNRLDQRKVAIGLISLCCLLAIILRIFNFYVPE